MKRIAYLTLIINTIICGCQVNRQHDRIYDEGVSIELAKLRKQTIKNLGYTLDFNIPADKNAAVEAEETIRFTLDKAQEIIIDFRENMDRIHELTVNGQPCAWDFNNEHIIIPKSAIRKGKNYIDIRFTAGEQSLNRNEEFLYTLLVPDRARTVFPCFEQPNLKAEFTLSLEVPAEWEAVSNTDIADESVTDNRKSITFKPTEPLSTYLFSFVAGKLEKVAYQDGDRTLTAYHRETDPKKIAQLGTIFEQVASSLHWLEDYTGIPYPFAKYSIVILPGFQYGGMEHTGATLYNDRRMFLSEHPTLDEELARTELIAHETAHMWFGDFVTMDWFNDVWTKEVFANYFASEITEPLFPSVNHSLNWIKSYTTSSLSEDRTRGTNSIRQDLDNLRNAGLIYGNIIYTKAPIMMSKLVEIIGEEAYQEGIQEYLKTFAYSNATWDDLIKILDAKTSVNLAEFSDVWVNQKGMPHISFAIVENELAVTQEDPLGRSLIWPQRFNVTFIGEGESSIEVNLAQQQSTHVIPEGTKVILPNTDGRGYGLFIPDSESMKWLLSHWQEIKDDTARQSLLMTIHENYQAKLISAEEWLTALLNGMNIEKNALIASSICRYLHEPLMEAGTEQTEEMIWKAAQNHSITSCRIQLMRCLISKAKAPKSVDKLYNIWLKQSHSLLNERDYMSMAYVLSLHLPEKYEEIISTQRARISNPDRVREFDFIAKAVTPDTLEMDKVFESLMKAENRRIEPWAEDALAYLNHPLREEYAVKYIRPGLEIMKEVQRTGDIFFPKYWAMSLLGGHRSEAAKKEVDAFFEAHPDYPQLLKNKILQAYPR